MEVIRGQATASANRVFVAACDRHGHERGVDWLGASVIIDENGWLLMLDEVQSGTGRSWWRSSTCPAPGTRP